MLDFITIANMIFQENLTGVRSTIINSLHNNLPSEFLEFKITVNLLSLCETQPSTMKTIVCDFITFKNDLEELVKQTIIKEFQNLSLEYPQMMNFNDFFNISFSFLGVPVRPLQCEIMHFYRLLQPKYFLQEIKSDIVADKQTLEVSSSISIRLIILKGKYDTLSELIEPLSSFFVCKNRFCTDKTHILKLKNMYYYFSDSKRTFTSHTSQSNGVCFHCHTPLEELLNKRKIRKTITFLMYDGRSSVKCKSTYGLIINPPPIGTTFYCLGYLMRSTKGALVFKAIDFYTIEEVEKIDTRKVDVHIVSKNLLMDNLKEIVGLYMNPIKETFSEEDVLLFLLLDIVKNNSKRLLLFTSDPVYAFRCAQNVLKGEAYCKPIYLDLKGFTSCSGICIRGLNDNVTKPTRVDLVFSLPISTFLDYKYVKPEEVELMLKISLKDEEQQLDNGYCFGSQTLTQYESINCLISDHKDVQQLFLKFREVYKEKVEPERLFDTVFLLYTSLERVMQGKQEEEYADFIQKYFIDKIV